MANRSSLKTLLWQNRILPDQVQTFNIRQRSFPPQIAMPTDDASHETGTMMPQQPTTMQLSGQSHPGFYSPSQSEIYSITSSSSDNTFGHPMYPDSNRRLQYTFGPDQRYSGGYTLDPTLTDNTDALWDISDMMPQEPGP